MKIKIAPQFGYEPHLWWAKHIGEVFEAIEYAPSKRGRPGYWTVDVSHLGMTVNTGFVAWWAGEEVQEEATVNDQDLTEQDPAEQQESVYEQMIDYRGRLITTTAELERIRERAEAAEAALEPSIVVTNENIAKAYALYDELALCRQQLEAAKNDTAAVLRANGQLNRRVRDLEHVLTGVDLRATVNELETLIRNNPKVLPQSTLKMVTQLRTALIRQFLAGQRLRMNQDQWNSVYPSISHGGHGWSRWQMGGTDIQTAVVWYQNFHLPGSKEWRPPTIMNAVIDAAKGESTER